MNRPAMPMFESSERASLSVSGRARGKGDDREQHREAHGQQAHPPEGARRAQLEELGGDQIAHSAVASSSRVSSRKTSSSEASADSATSSMESDPVLRREVAHLLRAGAADGEPSWLRRLD